ncbi:hypothetical protein ACFWGC_26630 [Cytobacillus pseudoceanisediminis]
MSLVSKQCVGCGIGFICSREEIENVLYCSDTCEFNHSLFSMDEEQPKTE